MTQQLILQRKLLLDISEGLTEELHISIELCKLLFPQTMPLLSVLRGFVTNQIKFYGSFLHSLELHSSGDR